MKHEYNSQKKKLPANMTVAQLKAKVYIEFEIPINVQRWIIGKNLADNDESTLEELQAVEQSSIFLYITTIQGILYIYKTISYFTNIFFDGKSTVQNCNFSG